MKSLLVIAMLSSQSLFAVFNEDCLIAVKDLNSSIFSESPEAYGVLLDKYAETVESCRQVYLRTSEESAEDFIRVVSKIESLCNKEYDFSYSGAKLEALGCKAQELENSI